MPKRNMTPEEYHMLVTSIFPLQITSNELETLAAIGKIETYHNFDIGKIDIWTQFTRTFKGDRHVSIYHFDRDIRKRGKRLPSSTAKTSKERKHEDSTVRGGESAISKSAETPHLQQFKERHQDAPYKCRTTVRKDGKAHTYTTAQYSSMIAHMSKNY